MLYGWSNASTAGNERGGGAFKLPILVYQRVIKIPFLLKTILILSFKGFLLQIILHSPLHCEWGCMYLKVLGFHQDTWLTFES